MPVEAVAGSTNVTINIAGGSILSIQRIAGRTPAGVFASSVITNNGTVSLTGAGSTGLNRGAGLLGLGNDNIITNGAGGSISTTNQFNDGMAADGSGNTLINNGAITTTGPSAYGMTASWGQSGGGQPNNTLINNGSVSTSGSTARAMSILGANGTVINTGSLLTTGSSSPAVYMQGSNASLTNSGIIRATGGAAAGGLPSDGVFSNTLGTNFNATIVNLPGGQIISEQGPAVRTLNGPTSITNAGLLYGGGGTAIRGGNGNVTLTLQTGSQIVGLANGGNGSNAVYLQGTGVADNPFTNFQTLSMNGADWTWRGSGDFHDSFINTGTFRLQAALTGNVSVAAGASLLAGDGYNPSIGPYPGGPPVTVTNAGRIDLTNGGAATANSLTVLGNYVGQGGTLALRTFLAGDGSPSDRLVISGGAASGSTSISVTNTGGGGAGTVSDGILLVQAVNGATTAASAFSLVGGSVSAGAYQYFLFHGGGTSGSTENWYLRSTVLPVSPAAPPPTPAPGTPALPPAGALPIPLYRPEVPVQAILPSISRYAALTTLGTFHERRGEQVLLQDNGTLATGWGRLIGQRQELRARGDVKPEFDGSILGLQAGLDLFGWESQSGIRDRLGLFYGYARAEGDVRGFTGGFLRALAGKLDIDANSLGVYWTRIGPSGWYLDTVLMHTWFDARTNSSRAISAPDSGSAVTASVEGGIPFALGNGWAVEAQGQFIWQHLALDRTSDPFATISHRADDAFTGRVGARLQSTMMLGDKKLTPYLKANLWHSFAGDDVVLFDLDPITTKRGGTSLEVGGGIVAEITKNVGLYATAGYTTNLGGAHRQTVSGNLGLRVVW